jgi:hypothetical protein
LGSHSDIKQDKRETLPKSIPPLPQVLQPFLRFGLNIPSSSFSPYTIPSIFPNRSVDFERQHGSDALGATVRGAWAMFAKRFYNQEGCNILILNLNKSSFHVPIHCIFVSLLLNTSTFKSER